MTLGWLLIAGGTVACAGFRAYVELSWRHADWWDAGAWYFGTLYLRYLSYLGAIIAFVGAVVLIAP